MICRVDTSPGNTGYTHDANGNRTSETANGVIDTYYYAANSNRLSNIARNAAATRIFTYDAAGNVIQDLRGANAYNYAVNNAGRIRQMSLNTGAAVVANYTYDGFRKLRIKSGASRLDKKPSHSSCQEGACGEPHPYR
jgi:YD repeat-containing protein